MNIRVWVVSHACPVDSAGQTAARTGNFMERRLNLRTER